MNIAPVNPRPQAGDVIIRRESDQTRRYTVGSLEHRTQLICPSRKLAIAQGTSYAVARGVRIWQVEDGERFTLIFSPAMDSHVTRC